MAKKGKFKRRNIRFLRVLKRTLILFIFFCLGGLTYSFGVATFENIESSILIKEFKERSTFEYSETVMYGTTEQVIV